MRTIQTDYPSGFPQKGDLTPGGAPVDSVTINGTCILVTDIGWRTAIYLRATGRRLETRRQLKQAFDLPVAWAQVADTRKDRLPYGVDNEETWELFLNETIGGY